MGRPGIARSRAIQKRKDTLLQEYKIKNKSNIFVDKRIGEKDAELSAEDKMIARFTAERMKKGGKKNIFNLGEEENLTHFGQAISELEQFDDDPRSDDEDFSSKNKMDADMNFGGFLNQHDMEFTAGKGNSRKEWIEQMIADSKKKKYEMQKDKEDALKMTQDLDQAWKSIVPNLQMAGSFVHTKQIKRDEEEEEEDKYDYNKIMKELVFEPKKAKAQDRLKTDEEIVKDEKERLEKLEELRQKRMRGEDVDEEKVASEEDDDASGDDEDEEDEDSEDESAEEEDKFSDLDEGSDHEQGAIKKAQKIVNKKGPIGEGLASEIPFTFAPPKSFEELQSLLGKRTNKEKCIVMERMIKCNHPQFGGENKAHMETLFRFLLQYIHDCASMDEEFESSEIRTNLDSINALMPFLFDLAKFSPQPSGEAIRSVLQEKFSEFSKSPKTYPPLESVRYLPIHFHGY